MRRAFRQPKRIFPMRPYLLLALAPLLLAAGCGSTEKTVVVAPPAGGTVVVAPNGDTHVVPPRN
jgi:hypothetical protein